MTQPVEQNVQAVNSKITTSHGTRSDYARWLHQQQPELTASQIAARVGLNVSSVRRAIKVNK